MLGLDLALVCLALAVSIYTQSRETSLLFFMCAGCSSATYLGVHTELGALWYPVLCFYFLIFFNLSRSLWIKVLYCCMQFLCLFSWLEFPTEQTFYYDNFALIMSLFYLSQLGISTYGNHDRIGYGDNSTKLSILNVDHFKAVA